MIIARDVRNHVVKILDAFAGAQVNPKPRAIDVGIVDQIRVRQGLLSSGGRKLTIGAGILPALRVFDEPPQVKVLDLGGKFRWK